MSDLILAFGLSFLAGISTILGSLGAFLPHHQFERWLTTGLGFSAGVMIYVSFQEILPKSQEHFQAATTGDLAPWLMLLFFVLGVLLSGVIDTIIPHLFHLHTQEEYDDSKLQDQDKHWLTSGLVTALAIGGHNLPEGMITFTSTLADPTVGLSIALAVALHNIPEGLAIALPVYKATHNRLQTLWYTVVAGLAEPLGALLGFWFLSQFLGDYALGFIFAIVAGIMIYISFDEILPTAFYKGNTHQVLYAILAGMIVMGSSLIWLG